MEKFLLIDVAPGQTPIQTPVSKTVPTPVTKAPEVNEENKSSASGPSQMQLSTSIESDQATTLSVPKDLNTPASQETANDSLPSPKSGKKRKLRSTDEEDPDWQESPTRATKRPAPTRRIVTRSTDIDSPDPVTDLVISSAMATAKSDHCNLYCNRVDENDMVECSGDVCGEGDRWFHIDCVGLKRADFKDLDDERIQWWCTTCRVKWGVGLKTRGIVKSWVFPEGSS